MEFTPRGEEVWISARDDNRVVVYDTATFAPLADARRGQPERDLLHGARGADGVLMIVTRDAARSSSRLLNDFQRGFPLVREPYAALARGARRPTRAGCAATLRALAARRRGEPHRRGVPARVDRRLDARRDGGAARSASSAVAALVSARSRGQPQLRARAPLQPLVRRRRRRTRRALAAALDGDRRAKPATRRSRCRSSRTTASTSVSTCRGAAPSARRCAAPRDAARARSRCPTPTAGWSPRWRTACRSCRRRTRRSPTRPASRRPTRWCGSPTGSNRGVIKRFGVVVRHRELGYRANAMCVWDVPDAPDAGTVDALGEALAREPGVTLCYRRARALPEWPYNLFCMVHGRDRATSKPARRARGAHGLARFPSAVLFSRRASSSAARATRGRATASTDRPRAADAAPSDDRGRESRDAPLRRRERAAPGD